MQRHEGGGGTRQQEFQRKVFTSNKTFSYWSVELRAEFFLVVGWPPSKKEKLLSAKHMLSSIFDVHLQYSVSITNRVASSILDYLRKQYKHDAGL